MYIFILSVWKQYCPKNYFHNRHNGEWQLLHFSPSNSILQLTNAPTAFALRNSLVEGLGRSRQVFTLLHQILKLLVPLEHLLDRVVQNDLGLVDLVLQTHHGVDLGRVLVLLQVDLGRPREPCDLVARSPLIFRHLTKLLWPCLIVEYRIECTCIEKSSITLVINVCATRLGYSWSETQTPTSPSCRTKMWHRYSSSLTDCLLANSVRSVKTLATRFIVWIWYQFILNATATLTCKHDELLDRTPLKETEGGQIVASLEQMARIRTFVKNQQCEKLHPESGNKIFSLQKITWHQWAMLQRQDMTHIFITDFV